jgi:HPt (histidine-containing phosphotransfer) domain-containing protein
VSVVPHVQEDAYQLYSLPNGCGKYENALCCINEKLCGCNNRRRQKMDRTTYLETIQQHLKTAYLLNEEKTAAMIPVFVNTLRSHVERLAELATHGDLQQLGQASHAVKGALLNMGLAELAQTAYSIEKQCRAGDSTFDYLARVTELQHQISLFTEKR